MTKQYIITEAERDTWLAIMRNNLQDPDAYDAIPELQSLQELTAEPAATPPFGSKRKAALSLYRAPFKFEHGYVFDADRHMVADDDNVDSHVAVRVRGWGRIGYMPDAAQLQDEVGKVIADALTAYWTASPLQPITAEAVTDEMQVEISKQRELFLSKKCFAAVINIWIKHGGGTK